MGAVVAASTDAILIKVAQYVDTLAAQGTGNKPVDKPCAKTNSHTAYPPTYFPFTHVTAP